MFAAFLALYSLFLRHKKKPYFVPKQWIINPKDDAEYAIKFSWLILALAGTCALAALSSLFNTWIGVAVLVIGIVNSSIIGWKKLKPYA